MQKSYYNAQDQLLGDALVEAISDAKFLHVAPQDQLADKFENQPVPRAFQFRPARSGPSGLLPVSVFGARAFAKTLALRRHP